MAMQQRYIQAMVTWEKHQMTSKLLALARVMICMYFFNQAYTGFEIWWSYRQPFPWINCWLAPCAVMVALDYKTVPMGSLMTTIAFYDASAILLNQLKVWWVHGHLYINELMVKKMSLLGAAVLVLAMNWQGEQRRTSQVAGLLLEKAENVMSDQKSIVMLVGRLLMSTLFLFVGYTEIKRQMDATVTDSSGNIHRRRASGDGHDSMVPKLIEFALSLPFTVGLKSKTTARCLAGVLILEALTSWVWFYSPLNIGYRIHAREHFMVNVGVAGALIMFAYIGAGKYSVDAYMKKRD